MSENENLEYEEEIDTGIESEDENQGEENSEIEESDDESEKPRKKSLVQTLRDEIRELKKAKKSENTSKLDQSLEMRLFFIENPDYKDNKDGILEVMKDHPTLSPEQANALYKTLKPRESENRKESFKGGAFKPKPKSIDNMSDEDAMKLNPKDYITYLRKKGELS